MEDITIKISLKKLIDLIIEEQRLGIKKYLISTLGQSAGDLLDKFKLEDSTILDTINDLTD